MYLTVETFIKVTTYLLHNGPVSLFLKQV